MQMKQAGSSLSFDERLANDEALAANVHIAGVKDVLHYVVWPCVAVLAVYAALVCFDVWLLKVLQTHRHSIYDSIFIIFTTAFLAAGAILIATNKRYDSRITAPLWFVMQEWTLIAGVPIFFALMLLATGGSRVGAGIGLTGFIVWRVVHTWKQTRQSVSYLTMDAIAITEDIVFVFCELTVRVLRRGLLVLRTIVRFILFVALELWLERQLARYLGRWFRAASDSRSPLTWTECRERSAVAPAGALRIAHLSDLHLRPTGDGDLENGVPQDPDQHETLIRAVVACSVDLVVVSGDVTDTGSAADYGVATEFFKRMRAAVGQSVPVIAVPGNHDLSVSPAVWTVSFGGGMRKVVNGVGSATRPFFSAFNVRSARFDSFAQTLGMIATAPLQSVNLFNYPALDLSVVTLCTAMPNSWLGFNAIGEFSRRAVGELRTLKPRMLGRLVVVCHHHARGPEGDSVFYGKDWMQAFKHANLCAVGSTRFADVLIRGLGRRATDCVVLHGHTHIPRLYDLQASTDAATQIPVRCAPSAFEGPAPGFMVHEWGTQLDTSMAKWNDDLRDFV